MKSLKHLLNKLFSPHHPRIIPLPQAFPHLTPSQLRSIPQNVLLVLLAEEDNDNATTATTLERLRTSPLTRDWTLSDLVDRAIAATLATFGNEANVLSRGYRRVGDDNPRGGVLTGSSQDEIECRNPNWIVNHIKSQKEWANLLEAIGDKAFLMLLTEIPMMLLRRSSGDEGEEDDRVVQLTGRAVDSFGSEVPSAPPPTMTMIINRRITFYSTKSFPAGLPNKHPMNLAVTGTFSEERSKWRKVSLTCARRFALETILKSNDKRLPRLPWGSLLPHIQKMLERQRKLNYRALFERIVILGEKEEEEDDDEDDDDRDLVPTQDLIADITTPSSSSIPSSTITPIPYARVIAFLKAVVLRVVPRALLGTGKKGRRHALSKIGLVVSARRGDVIGVEDLMVGCPPHELLPQRRDAAKWFRFVFQELVCASLHAFFYVTESAEEPDVLRYYRKDEWRKFVSAQRFSFLAPSNLSTMTTTTTRTNSKSSQLPINEGKLLPKREDATRLIVNLSKKRKFSATSPLEGGFSVNQSLKPAFHILKHEAETQGERFLGAACVFGLDDVLSRLRDFLSRCPANAPIFAVALDVSRCFDSMDHEKLKRRARSVVRHDSYAVSNRTFLYLDRGQDKLRVKRARVVGPAKSAHSWMDGVDVEDDQKKEFSLRCDGVVRWLVSRAQVDKLIEDLIERTVVKVPGLPPLRQTVGIPQGSVVSSLLCNAYFGEFEKAELREFVTSSSSSSSRDEDHTLLMRMVDDFLLLTTSKVKATTFKERMESGFPAWGVEVNAGKTQFASFSLDGVDEDGTFHEAPTAEKEWVSWCGILFNCRTRALRLCYDKVSTRHAPTKSRAKALESILRGALAGKLHPIFFDEGIHTPTEAAINFAQAFALCGARYHACARAGGGNRVRGFGMGALRRLIDYAFCLVQTRREKRGVMNSESRREMNSSNGITAEPHIPSYPYHSLRTFRQLCIRALIWTLEIRPSLHLENGTGALLSLRSEATSYRYSGVEEVSWDWGRVREETKVLARKLLSFEC